MSSKRKLWQWAIVFLWPVLFTATCLLWQKLSVFAGLVFVPIINGIFGLENHSIFGTIYVSVVNLTLLPLATPIMVVGIAQKSFMFFGFRSSTIVGCCLFAAVTITVASIERPQGWELVFFIMHWLGLAVAVGYVLSPYSIDKKIRRKEQLSSLLLKTRQASDSSP